MKSKMLGALALFTLIGALFVMQSAASSPPTADAATGTIHALNVGTCLTTDLATFGKEDCALAGEGAVVDWEVREEVEEVSTLYATYAFDPKTASNEPRVIVQDADLIKISISDSGRDKRTGVLVKGEGHDDLGANDEADGIVVVRKLLDAQDIASDSVDFENTDVTSGGVELTVQNAEETNRAHINSSGNRTLNFAGDDAGDDTYKFKPMDIGGTIRFFGCATDDANCVLSVADGGTNDTKPSNDLVDVTSYLEIDEDGSSGSTGDNGDTAPWMSVNASVPSTVDIVIYAVYYETSDRETLDGGQVFSSCSSGELESTDNGDEVIPKPGTDATPINTEWKCVTKDAQGDVTAASEADTENESTDVVFTEDEIEDNDALTVLAKADGDQQSVDLYLTETGRFSGQYVGSLRLTDANGDGSVKDDPGTTTDETASRDDWGREVIDGDASVEAVLGVSSGPVTIEYRDTDGRTRTLRIEIDNQPPAISITNPVHGTSSDDHTPDYNGSIEDTDSGIVSDSFRLVVDNKIDGTDDGATNADFALEGKVPDARNVVVSADARTTGIVSHASDYYGYSDAAHVVGVAWPDMMYNLGRESCSNQPVCHIKADRHDDGANTATFSDSIRLNLQDGTKGPAETRDREYQVDFQAFAMDRAGNIGFSDSDSANPRFIRDLGTAESKRDKQWKAFGYYSAHIITLDEKDPEVKPDRSATGFYGADSNGKMIVDRSGVMVVFDGPIDSSSVTTDTFAVDLDEDTAATVTDVDVEKNYVFLKLADMLDSDATPMVEIAVGGKVEDMAGNETFANEFEQFTLQDGITPQLTVTLSGGSGTGTGSEGAGKLTKDQMTVHIESDEELQGTPRVAVVCSDLSWIIEEDETKVSYDIDDYVGNRSGAFSSIPTETPTTQMPKATNTDAAGKTYGYTCDYDADDDNFEDDYAPDPDNSLKRTGNNWEYTWQNPSGPARMLENELLTAVVFARDRSRYYDADGNDLQNWGSASAEFKLDTTLQAPTGDGLQPGDGDMVKESRPFVLIEFDEPTTVTLESVELDDVEIKDDFERPQDNRFVYWPASIAQGDHEVEVEAVDAAGNPVFFEYNFEVADRGDFLINLLAGWNAISVPADPVDTAIGAVFTDPSVDTVIGWDTQGWRIAVRRDGVWESNQKYAALNEIRARYGYWVKSRNFVRQPVELRGPVSRTDGGNPGLISIQTVPGWNFVGVIDQDGDQTEDDFSNSLQGSDGQLVTASEYLGQNYVRAYTWDATFNRFDVVRPIDAMKIGAGVWVYYEGGIAP